MRPPNNSISNPKKIFIFYQQNVLALAKLNPLNVDMCTIWRSFYDSSLWDWNVLHLIVFRDTAEEAISVIVPDLLRDDTNFQPLEAQNTKQLLINYDILAIEIYSDSASNCIANHDKGGKAKTGFLLNCSFSVGILYIVARLIRKYNGA